MQEAQPTARDLFKRDPRNQAKAIERHRSKALRSFEFFVTRTMQYDGTRGLSKRQRLAGMRAKGADATDFTDPAYRWVWPFFEKAETISSLLMLPRFTGKTTLVALWCQWLGLRNANIRIGIIGYKFELASSILGMIRMWMSVDTAGNLRKVFGPGGYLPPLGQKWGRDDYLIFPLRSAVQRDPTISAVGMKEASEGGHFDVVILEDLVNLKSAATAAGIAEVRNFVQMSSGLGMTIHDEQGNVIGRAPKLMVGTPWDDADAYMTAIKGVAEELAEGKSPTWNILRLQCRIPREAMREVEAPDGTRGFQKVLEYDEACQARFRHLPDRLLREYRYSKDGFGAVGYAAQMDLDPIPLANRTLRREWFEDHFYEDDAIWEPDPARPDLRRLKPTLVRAGFVDLAGTTGDSKDRSAHGAWVIDPRGHLYLVEAVAGRFGVEKDDQDRLTPNGNLNIMADWTRKYGLSFIGCEGGVLRTVYEGEMRRWNRNNPDRPIRMVKVASGGARGNRTNDRALAIASMAERGEIHLKREQADVLEELLRYTPDKDNTADDYVAMTALACLNRTGWGSLPAAAAPPPKTVLEMMDDAAMAEAKGDGSDTYYYE